ncbi:AraC family transcriptional regulator [uncultured Tenacibaculum sp.]|uniref:helix-turn-helix domain-containing protein n=1 Tax=uncultured Tenacibaculum sp. TaxID=174713 RepID=UPI00262D9624|nr:AraC family transcriptional regulator [uncultured Tenacibaculum sp.]
MLSNTLLALILVFMAFRVGKSILLNFGDELEPIFIFIGLAFILLIGPLLRWYFKVMTIPNFKIQKANTLEMLPFLMVSSLSLFITKDWFDENNKEAVILFGSTLIFIYLHFIVYIALSYRVLKQVKKLEISTYTKSQKAIITWLQLLVICCIVIWISYFLNIIENTIPYIIGPVLYSLAIYFLTYKAFELNSIDIDGNAFKTNDDDLFFKRITNYIIDEKQFLNPNISLTELSKLLGLSTQKTSGIINEYSKQNFNDFINHYRILEAKRELLSKERENYKISSIAFDVGFNSLSSFNSAFKKFVGVTPSVFKKENNITNS